MSKILYALPAFADQNTVDDHRIGAMSRKALRHGVSHRDSHIEEIIDSVDRKLFSQITKPNNVHIISSLGKLVCKWGELVTRANWQWGELTVNPLIYTLVYVKI